MPGRATLPRTSRRPGGPADGQSDPGARHNGFPMSDSVMSDSVMSDSVMSDSVTSDSVLSAPTAEPSEQTPPAAPSAPTPGAVWFARYSPKRAGGRQAAAWPLGAAAVAVLLAGVVLRFVAHTHLWLDEAQSVAIARLPLPGLFAALRQDGSPPLYYLLLHYWMGWFGTGDNIAVRALSGVISVATLPPFYLLARRTIGRHGGRAAAGQLAVRAALRHRNPDVRAGRAADHPGRAGIDPGPRRRPLDGLVGAGADHQLRSAAADPLLGPVRRGSARAVAADRRPPPPPAPALVRARRRGGQRAVPGAVAAVVPLPAPAHRYAVGRRCVARRLHQHHLRLGRSRRCGRAGADPVGAGAAAARGLRPGRCRPADRA